jgi:hypothetical protein
MKYAESLDALLQSSAVVVIVNPLAELNGVDWSKAKHTKVVDCWRCLDAKAMPRDQYIRLGIGPEAKLSEWVGHKLGHRFSALTE